MSPLGTINHIYQRWKYSDLVFEEKYQKVGILCYSEVEVESSKVGSSPAALAVEEVDEEEFLCGPELHLLSGSENVLGGGGGGSSAAPRCPPVRRTLGAVICDGQKRRRERGGLE